jgi:hypothetical protein
MALKSKNPTETPSTLPPVNETYEKFASTVHPEVDKRLNAYIEANPLSKEYQEYLVKRHPDRAVRALMLDKMFKYEAQMRRVERETPQAQEWLEKQTPTLKDWIAQKLKDVNPFYREKTQHELIKRVKNKIDFAPRNDFGQGMSV